MIRILKRDIMYAPLNAFLHVIGMMPFGVLYVLSDFIYFIVFHVVGYRRKIVQDNLRISFPEKRAKEIDKIEKDFYRWFADYFVETIKMLHISDEQMRRRFVMHNMDIIDKHLDEGRSVVAYAAHYGNWEWLTSITLWTGHKDVVFAQVYRPLVNEWFDKFFLNLRKRFHSVGYTKKSVFRDLIRLRRDGTPFVTGFMSDQHPNVNDSDHVVRFLNHDTALITGTEVVARKLNCAIVYLAITRSRRGHYDCTVSEIPVGEDATDTQFPVTDVYARMLESQICNDPSIWLWTHNRWKHKVKSVYNKDNVK